MGTELTRKAGRPLSGVGGLTGSNPDWDLRIGTVSRHLGSVRSVVGIRLSAELPVTVTESAVFKAHFRSVSCF
jgi:hypothetical protein